MQPTEDIEPPSLSNSARNGKDKARAVVNEWAQLSADECWNSKNMLSLGTVTIPKGLRGLLTEQS